MDERKDFFHIGIMTAEFRKFPTDTLKDDRDYRIWDLRFKLAIAQQLSVISGSLSRLVALCEAQSERK